MFHPTTEGTVFSSAHRTFFIDHMLDYKTNHSILKVEVTASIFSSHDGNEKNFRKFTVHRNLTT
jgi:hypothetical protein